MSRDTAGQKRRAGVGITLIAIGVICVAAALGIGFTHALSARARITAVYEGRMFGAPAPSPLLHAPETENQAGVRVNIATAQELDRLPGIGPSLAQAIIDCRETDGPFHFAEDLAFVKGIGENKLKDIRPLITLP